MAMSRTSLTVALLGVTAVVLSACGGSTEETPGGSGTSSAGGASQSNAGTPILPAPLTDFAALATTASKDACSSDITDPVTEIIKYQYEKAGNDVSSLKVETSKGIGPGNLNNCTFSLSGSSTWNVPTVSVAVLPAAENPLSTTVDDLGRLAPIEPAPAGLDIQRPCNDSDVLNPAAPCSPTRIAYDQAGLITEEVIAATGKTFLDPSTTVGKAPDSGYRKVNATTGSTKDQINATRVVGDDWLLYARIAPSQLNNQAPALDAYFVSTDVTGGGDPDSSSGPAADLTMAISDYFRAGTSTLPKGSVS